MESRTPDVANLSKYLLSYRPLPNFIVEESTDQDCLPTCRAKGLPFCEPTSENTAEEEEKAKYFDLSLVKKVKLFECPIKVSKETEEVDKEIEEESATPTTEYDLQTDDIHNEVERIKLRVSQLDRLLGFNIPECPEIDSCLDIDIELKKNSVNPDILRLQRNYRKLQQQKSQLELARKASDFSMNKLKEMVNGDRAASGILHKHIDELDSFKRIIEYEQALCAQRYRHLENEKYSGNQWHSSFKKALDNVESVLLKYMTKTDYENKKRIEIKKIRYLNQRGRKLYDYMFESFEKLDTSIRKDSPMQSVELITLLYRNEKIFNGHRFSQRKK